MTTVYTHEGQQGAVNGQDIWGFFRVAQGFGRLDAGSHAGLTSLSTHHHRPRYYKFPYFCMMCGLEKLGLVDQNR